LYAGSTGLRVTMSITLAARYWNCAP
jgi:hypothetical protein